jgi:hypothetical protein
VTDGDDPIEKAWRGVVKPVFALREYSCGSANNGEIKQQANVDNAAGAVAAERLRLQSGNPKGGAVGGPPRDAR